MENYKKVYINGRWLEPVESVDFDVIHPGNEEAVEFANATPFGLAAYIQSTDRERINRVSRKLRAGVINVNGNAGDYDVPFGGYKESRNGREAGPLGFHKYLETKAITI